MGSGVVLSSESDAVESARVVTRVSLVFDVREDMDVIAECSDNLYMPGKIVEGLLGGAERRLARLS